MPLVLIVDDEVGLLVLFSRIIEQLGCDVIKAATGGEALDLLDAHTPDLLILDLAMPEVSGEDVLRTVRETPRLDGMKVMIITARAADPEVERLTYDDWVYKPILPSDFKQRVAALLNL